MKKIVAVIPARYKSSRFLGKPLADIWGKPMIWWVYNQVIKVKKINQVIVATDDLRIVEVCQKFNLDYVLTSEHTSSTERLNEVAQKIDADYYICINGDEPLIEPETIDKIIPNEHKKNEFYVSNLMTKIKKGTEIVDSTNIKVVFNKDKEAIYMSRSPIPYPKNSIDFNYFKHIGVLCYNKEALHFFSYTKKGILEKIEDINELRFIENKIPIKMVEVDADTLSVDTPKDLEYVKDFLRKKQQSR